MGFRKRLAILDQPAVTAKFLLGAIDAKVEFHWQTSLLQEIVKRQPTGKTACLHQGPAHAEHCIGASDDLRDLRRIRRATLAARRQQVGQCWQRKAHQPRRAAGKNKETQQQPIIDRTTKLAQNYPAGG